MKRSDVGPLMILALCVCKAGSSQELTSPPTATEGEQSACFLAYDLKSGERLEWEEGSCEVPTSPASTFKLPHALIGLETGVVEEVDAIRPWDAAAHPDAEWGREDQTLTTAIRDSVVWFFQEVAAGVGRERMSKYLSELHYGNEAIGDALTTFWLDGSLQITAHEQLDFLRKLATEELPVAKHHIASLQRILDQPLSELRWRVEDPADFADVWSSDVRIEFKTGTTRHGPGNVSWLVGRVRHPRRDLVFVSRVLGTAPPGARSLAVEVALRTFEEQGLL